MALHNRLPCNVASPGIVDRAVGGHQDSHEEEGEAAECLQLQNECPSEVDRAASVAAGAHPVVGAACSCQDTFVGENSMAGRVVLVAFALEGASHIGDLQQEDKAA